MLDILKELDNENESKDLVEIKNKNDSLAEIISASRISTVCDEKSCNHNVILDDNSVSESNSKVLDTQDEELVDILEELINEKETENIGDNFQESESNPIRGHFCSDTVFKS